MSITKKLGGGFLFFVLAPIMAILAINQMEMKESISQSYQNALRSEVTKVIDLGLGGMVQTARNILDDASQDPRIIAAVTVATQEKNGQPMRDLISAVKKDFGLTVLEVVGTDGVILFSTQPHRNGLNMAQTEQFKGAVAHVQKTGFIHDDATENYIILSSMSIKNPAGAAIAVLQGGFILDHAKLREFVGQGDAVLLKQEIIERKMKQAATTAQEGDNKLSPTLGMALRTPRVAMEPFQDVMTACQANQAADACQKLHFHISMEQTGEDYLVIAGVPLRMEQPLPFASLLVSQPVAQMKEDITRSRNHGLMMAGIFSVLAVLMGLLLTRSIVKPLQL
ncbi:MAG: hypothetical protein H7838_11690, partial [Magnetococcus sp. DMHC-8]